MQGTERECIQCGHKLRGRLDKKFCNDACRNTYNNRKNTHELHIIRHIQAILRSNRRILKAFIPEGTNFGKCTRHQLAKQGFDFNYCTHRFTSKKGNAYTFCYEYGYLSLEEEKILVVKQKTEVRSSHSWCTGY